MNHQPIVDANLAAIGAGTVLENADRWPSKLDRIKSALAAVEGAIERKEGKHKIHFALRELCYTTSDAYRSFRIAIGDPRFPPSGDDPVDKYRDWPGETLE